jgi:hypothetical protein
VAIFDTHLASMGQMRVVRSIAGLQRLWDAHNNRYAHLYGRRYILAPAAADYAQRFHGLEDIEDDQARFEAFRRIPSIETDLEAIDRSLSPKDRLSLAQQDRARHSRQRVGPKGQSLESVALEVLSQSANPWKLKAKQFWQPFIDHLRKLGLDPIVIFDAEDPSLETIHYGPARKRTLSRGQFENIVGRARKQFPRN